MSGPEGIGTWAEADGIDWWYADQHVTVARPDGEGGVVFQPYPDETGCTPIMRLAEPGADADLLIDTINGRCVRLDAVGTTEGTPHLIYSYSLPPEEDEEFSFVRQLVLHDVENGTDSEFEMEFTFDGGLLSASISNQRLALTFQGSSEQGLARFYDQQGNASEPPFPPPSNPGGDGDCWTGDLSPDGSLYAYGHVWGLCAYGAHELEIINLETGEELANVVLTATVEWPGARSVSFDSTGEQVLVVTTDTPPILIEADGTTTSLDTVPPSLWTLRQVEDPGECVIGAFANSHIWCDPEYHITFW